MKDFKPTLFDRAISAVAPEAGMKRIAARKVLHEFSYDGARQTTRRRSAPQNISPNSFDVQRDRLQLLREAEDMERNFAPAKHLNRKYALYTAPISYHAQTGDPELDTQVEDYLNNEVFPNCDVTGRFDFFKMMEFGVMGCNRGGDYGWAFLRPDIEDDSTEEEALQLDLKIQAVEPDRIGGVYQNVVSNNYVSGLIIGKFGQIDAFRVFHRSMTTSVYDNPVDIPASQFVHMTDPMRIDTYRGVSVLSTAIQNLRDIYEVIDFAKGKAKLASAMTVFTSSSGATTGGGAFDAYQTNIPDSGGSAVQQDIDFGLINHLPQGLDIKFPSSSSPSAEEQWLITQLLKFVAMSYGLPYSFALDASTLGGVSSRLESEMAKAEFERGQRVLSPHAHRIKDTFLIDAVAKGIFPIEKLSVITKGRWGYRPHPQPDIGKEATAAVNMHQNGLLDPMKHWVDNAQDPEDVVESMVRYATMKREAASKAGFTVQEVFGAGPAMPLSQSESTTQNLDNHLRNTDEIDGINDPDADGDVTDGTGHDPTDIQADQLSDLGLNGAQVTSLSDLASKVSSGEMPVSNAKALASAAFPSIPSGTIDQIFDDLENTNQPEDKDEFSRHDFATSDSELTKKITAQKAVVEELRTRESKFRKDLRESTAAGEPSQRSRVAIDKIVREIEVENSKLKKLTNQKSKGDKKPETPSTPSKSKAIKATNRNERHALTIALMRDGKEEKEAFAAAYDIIEKGQFSWSKLPSDIQDQYKD